MRTTQLCNQSRGIFPRRSPDERQEHFFSKTFHRILSLTYATAYSLQRFRPDRSIITCHVQLPIPPRPEIASRTIHFAIHRQSPFGPSILIRIVSLTFLALGFLAQPLKALQPLPHPL